MTRWRSVLWVIPVPVTTSNNMSDFAGAVTNGPFIRIKPQYLGDEGLIQHELQHVRQFWIPGLVGVAVAAGLYYYGFEAWFLPGILGFCVKKILYSASDRFRLWAEVSAFKAQMKAMGLTEPAKFMLDALEYEYGLGYDRDFILEQF